MFPDVRLLIAATFASVVALICGFALFAAFRVSHEPLVRLPPAAAPPQLLAESSAAPPMAFAPAEPFDRRFQLSEPQRPGEAVASPLRMLERRQGAEQGAQSVVDPSAAAPSQDAAEVDATAATGAAAQAAPILPAAPPADELATTAATPNENDQAPASQPEAAPAAEPGLTAAAAPAPSVAAVEPATMQTEIAPATVTASPVVEAVLMKDTAVATKAKHSRVAVRIRRVRQEAGAVSAFPNQTSLFQQPKFQTAPQLQQPQLSEGRPAKIRRAKIAASKSKESDTATGGPFVNAPNH